VVGCCLYSFNTAVLTSEVHNKQVHITSSYNGKMHPLMCIAYYMHYIIYNPKTVPQGARHAPGAGAVPPQRRRALRPPRQQQAVSLVSTGLTCSGCLVFLSCFLTHVATNSFPFVLHRWRPTPDRHRVAIVLYQTQLGRTTGAAAADNEEQGGTTAAAVAGGDEAGEQAGSGATAADVEGGAGGSGSGAAGDGSGDGGDSSGDRATAGEGGSDEDGAAAGREREAAGDAAAAVGAAVAAAAEVEGTAAMEQDLGSGQESGEEGRDEEEAEEEVAPTAVRLTRRAAAAAGVV
jgi:hypothetical protein